MSEPFNPKITFRFIEYLFQCRPINESGRQLKKIYKGEAQPETDFQYLFVTAINAYNYLHNKVLTIGDIVELSKLFPTQDLELTQQQLTQLEQLVSFINNSNGTLNDVIFIFMTTIEFSFIPEYKIELAKLLANYPLFHNDLAPIIMYETYTTQIVNLIELNGSNQEIENIFHILKERTDSYNNAHEDIPLSAIKDKLYKNQQVLQKHFGINHLFIYGSYSRNEQTIYSDLDLLVIPYQRSYFSISKKQIADFLEKEIKIPCDISLKNYSFDSKRIPSDMFDGVVEVF